MKRKTAQQQEWERLKPEPGQWLPVRGWTPDNPKTSMVRLTRRQFARIWQMAYRRGVVRAAKVAVQTSGGSIVMATRGDIDGDQLIGYRMGVDDSYFRICDFLREGAKDE